jgi:MoaA/NifB/PqqE/SkfB family radical SAM enzyme
MKLVWFPAWACQNYATDGTSYGRKCPYCPYGLDKSTNRLVYVGKATALDERAPAQDLVDFFNANYSAMNGRLEVSGGEALMRPDLHEILAAIPHRWAITSNTLMSTAIARLIDSGALSRCTDWTASWHPCSGMEDSYRRSIVMLADAGLKPRSTIVIADSTIEKLPETVAFLESLPIEGANFHVDAHGPSDVAHLIDAADKILGAGATYLAGPPPQGKICDMHSKLMAVGADGSLYPCVTFAYQDIGAICKVNGSVMLDQLPEKVEFCSEVCFACCDAVKHVA